MFYVPCCFAIKYNIYTYVKFIELYIYIDIIIISDDKEDEEYGGNGVDAGDGMEGGDGHNGDMEVDHEQEGVGSDVEEENIANGVNVGNNGVNVDDNGVTMVDNGEELSDNPSSDGNLSGLDLYIFFLDSLIFDVLSLCDL